MWGKKLFQRSTAQLKEIEQQNCSIKMNLTFPATGEYHLCHGKFSSLLLEGNDRMKD